MEKRGRPSKGEVRMKDEKASGGMRVVAPSVPKMIGGPGEKMESDPSQIKGKGPVDLKAARSSIRKAMSPYRKG